MKYLLAKLRFVLLLLVMLSASQTCYGFPVIKTSPHVFALHFVSALEHGPIIPQMSMKVDFAAYVGSPSYRQFLAPGEANYPEGAVARYIQILLDGHRTLTPETRTSALLFYDESERNNKATFIDEQVKDLHNSITEVSDLRMLHRYDVGGLSLIYLGHIESGKLKPLNYVSVRQVGKSFVITTYGMGVTEQDWILSALIYLNTSRIVEKETTWNDEPKPIYKYTQVATPAR